MFAPRKDHTLSRILITLVVIGLLGAGGFRAWTWYTAHRSAAPAAPDTSGGAPPPSSESQPPAEAAKGTPPVETEQSLQTILERNDASTPEAALSLAHAQQQSGKKDDAKRVLERAYNDFASAPEHPKIAAAYAKTLEEGGAVEEAGRIYQQVYDKAPRDMRASAATGLGRMAERNKDLLKAREFYREAFDGAPWDSVDWNEALDALGQVNVAIVFSPQETPESKVYTVGKRDSITSIGNALNTTQGLLMRANHIDETTVLSMGRRLKYTPKDFRIIIERSKCRLFLMDNNGIFKRYVVGLGAPGHETTLGTYKIGNKEKNPIWHKPGSAPIPAGDPNNQLGSRWMPLVPDQEGLPRDLGIHGTISPETVGKYTSNGCARLLPEQIEELYDLVVRSTPVEIVDVFSPEKAKGAAPAAPATAAQAKS